MDRALAEFERLYDEYSDAMFRHMYLRLGDRERAKELTQEIFMRLWQHLAAGKPIEYEKAFLYRIAHNLFVNEIRTDKKTLSLEQLMEESGYDVKDESGDASFAANHHELLRQLEKLKQSYREVLIMRYIDDLPITQISQLLGETETNISMRLKRALEKLKHCYELDAAKK